MNTESHTPNTKPKLIDFDPRRLDPSPYQDRKEFDPEKLAELTDAIKRCGIIQPLVARYATGQTAELNDTLGLERLELVAGERRMRAAIAAGLELVPVLVSEMTDDEAEDKVLTENLQRDDLTPSEEAHAFERLLNKRGAQGEVRYTIQDVAKIRSKDVKYVAARIKLLLCPHELVEAVNKDVVSVSTAMLIGQIPDAKARAIAAKEVLKPGSHGMGPEQEVAMTFVQTRAMIREHFMVVLDAKNFDLNDERLVPLQIDAKGDRCLGGACADCPFRSGNLEGVELKKAGGDAGGGAMGASANLCTLPRCHKLKLDAVWREKKLQAEQAGKATLDGKAAVKAFGGINGQLAHDSGLARLSDAERIAKENGVKLSVLDVPHIVARHPETLAVVELVDWHKTLPVINEAAEAKRNQEAEQPVDVDAAKKAADEKERKDTEELQKKLDKLVVHEGLTEIVNHITGKGMDGEFYDLLFQLALGSGGADGMFCVAKWLEIKLPKGTANSGRDYEEEILRVVRERCETPNAWLGFMAVALVARGVKWSGVRDEDFELVLSRCGVKLKELQRRAQALHACTVKPVVVEAEKPVANSVDKTDWSTEHEASVTAASDATEKAGVVFNAELPDSGKTKLAGLVLPGRELGKGAFIASNLIGHPEKWKAVDVEAGATLLKAETHKITDLIGPPPVRAEKEKLKVYNRVRLQLLRAVKKVKAGGQS